MLVPTRIGHSTDTPISCSRSSRYSTSARATTPYLATQYGPRPLFGHEPGERRREQDVAALALLDDAGQERLDAVDRAPQVDVDRPAPVVVGHVEDRAADGDAGVVEHDVDLAEGIERGVGHRLHGLQRAHVADDAVGLGTVGAQLGDGAVEGALLDVGQHDLGPLRRQHLRRRQADPAGAAGDDGPLAVERVHGRRSWQGLRSRTGTRSGW